MRAIRAPMARKLMAAADLFAERGLDASKMEDVAAVTGIPKATLYYYFTGKEEVLAFLFHQILGVVHQVVEQAAASPGPAALRLQGVIAAHLQVFADYPTASRALQFDLGRAARLPDIASSVEAAFVGPVIRLLQEGAQDGSLRPVPHPRMVATALLGAVTTTGMQIMAPDQVPSVAEVISSLVLEGLQRKGTP